MHLGKSTLVFDSTLTIRYVMYKYQWTYADLKCVVIKLEFVQVGRGVEVTAVFI
jgi:hypothetical protein